MRSLPVRISPRAKHDLRQIGRYIAARSPINAAKFMTRLKADILALGDYGQGVGLAPEAWAFDFPLRQIVVTPYRILFRADRQKIEVLHVRHGNRLPATPDRRGNPN